MHFKYVWFRWSLSVELQRAPPWYYGSRMNAAFNYLQKKITWDCCPAACFAGGYFTSDRSCLVTWGTCVRLAQAFPPSGNLSPSHKYALQCCGSGFIESVSRYGSGSSFFSESGSGSNPYPGFWWPKIEGEKNAAFYLFWPIINQGRNPVQDFPISLDEDSDSMNPDRQHWLLILLEVMLCLKFHSAGTVPDFNDVLGTVKMS